MSDDSNTTTRPLRTRSRGFPVVPLNEAADIVKRAGRYGQSHAETEFARYMGHTTTNSGAFKQRFAAMRSWGLVLAQRGQVALTDLGKRVAYPVSPEDESQAVREAFLNASAFAELYTASAKGHELDTAELANRAVHQLGVSPKSMGKFAQCFAASVTAAGLAQEPAPGKLVLIGEEERGDTAGDRPEPATQQTGRASIEEDLQRPRARDDATAPVVHQVWPVAGGSVSFDVRLDRPLPAGAFSQLAGIFEAVERLVSQLGQEADTE